MIYFPKEAFIMNKDSFKTPITIFKFIFDVLYAFTNPDDPLGCNNTNNYSDDEDDYGWSNEYDDDDNDY